MRFCSNGVGERLRDMLLPDDVAENRCGRYFRAMTWYDMWIN